MNSLNDRLKDKLNKRSEKGILRSLNTNIYSVDFYSNDYLGLSKVNFPELNTLNNSGTGSRLISGTCSVSIETEELIARTYNSEASLVFNSGYDANLGLISSIPQKGDTILFDEYIHASARDGISLSQATGLKFRHNDLNHLESRLEKVEGICFVLVESIYSMHGDFCDLKAISAICEKYKAHLIVDEAHAGAVIGKNGGGLTEYFGLENKVFARILTFGKGFGAHGACVIGSKLLINSLVNFARSFIYTTALPEKAYYRIKSIIEETNFKALQKNLKKNILRFIDSKNELLSPIQVIDLGNITKLKDLEKRLTLNNIGAKAIFSPTVPMGEERLRLCIHTFNTVKEIEILKTLIKA